MQQNKKRVSRPNGAFKLHVFLLYGQFSHMERMPRGFLKLQSVRKLARLLGTESKKINRWLHWLEEQGYIESLSYAEDRRSAALKIRMPSSVNF